MLSVEIYANLKPQEKDWRRYASVLRGRRTPGWNTPWPPQYEATAEPFIPIGACAVRDCPLAAAADALHNARINQAKLDGRDTTLNAAPLAIHNTQPAGAAA